MCVCVCVCVKKEEGRRETLDSFLRMDCRYKSVTLLLASLAAVMACCNWRWWEVGGY